MNWDEYYIRQADVVALKSKDSSTKVGAVLVGPANNVISTGYNDLPRGVRDDLSLYPERRERPAKYQWTEHAERNAIYNAARHGIKTEGATLYLNVGSPPCVDCMRAIIQAGIRRVVYPNRVVSLVGNGVHYDTNGVSPVMAREAGLHLQMVAMPCSE